MPINPGSKKGVLDICAEKCTIHNDKVIEFFCETCDELGCHVCITLDHRQCDKVKHIPAIAKDLIHSQEFTAFQESINSTTDKLSEFEQKIQANAISVNDMQKVAKQELKRQRAEVNKYFNELEQKMNNQILTLEKRNEATLTAASDKLKPMKNDLDQIKNNIETKKTGQNCELFISMKKSKEKLRTFHDKFNKLEGELKIQQYTLIPSEQIQTMMRTTTEICKISTAVITIEISETPTGRTTTEISKTPTGRTTTEISIKQTARTTTQFSGTPKARLESVIDIKTKKDKTEPNIYSLTTMHGHYCVVVDNGNKCIKVVDTKNKQVTSEIGIEAKTIWSVTSVSDDQVVVSVTLSVGKYRIQFFSVTTSGIIEDTNQRYDVKYFYMDMVYFKGNIYGVSDVKIDILSMTGKIIRTIQTDDKGANLFSYMRGIALSPDGQTIYVTDGNKNSVTKLTLDGKVKAIYTDKDLEHPLEITVDTDGYIYVRSWGTKNIRQLTTELKKGQVLIEDVVGDSINYSSTENKLYVSNKGKINEYSINYK